MKKILAIATLICVVLLGYTVTGPYRAVANIKTGIHENDTEKLTNAIQFEDLRKNVKDQLKAKMAQELQGGILGALATGFTSTLVDGLVENIVTPEGLASLMENGRPLLSNKKGSSTPEERREKKEKLFKNAIYKYESLSDYSITVPTENGDDHIKLIVHRYGINWKLSNIIFPAES